MSRWLLLSLAALLLATAAAAGVVNPDISVIGQPFARWTDGSGDPTRKRVTFDPGETELLFEAPLNPYAKGTFVLALGDEGLELEEGYFVLSRGLPGGIAIKGGKYRAGFGKLNPVHPHALPFAERFGVMGYLPGDEALNETGVQVSELIALPGDVSITASADVFGGETFRIPRDPSGALNDPLARDPDADRFDEPRPAVLGRVSSFVPLGERSGLELGASGTTGTNNVAATSRTTVFGGDVKAKLWTKPNSYLLIQGEVLHLDREEAGWDETAAAYTTTTVDPTGGYVFADYNFSPRWNAGASYERFQQPTADKTTDQAFGVFAGLSLMEETTSFRLDWSHLKPGRPSGATEDPDAVNTVTLRVIYSMGPHKAHQF